MVALEFGKMQPMAAHLSKTERGLSPSTLPVQPRRVDRQHRCAGPAATDATDTSPTGAGRAQPPLPAHRAGRYQAATWPPPELAWAAFPKVTDMRSQPAIVGDTLYFGDKTGKLCAIDRQRGCVRNYTGAQRHSLRDHRGDLNDGSKLLVFADSMATICAVDPAKPGDGVAKGRAYLRDLDHHRLHQLSTTACSCRCPPTRWRFRAAPAMCAASPTAG